MVYDSETLKPYHELTKQGEEVYREILQSYSDEMLFKLDHPVLDILMKTLKIFKIKSNIIEKEYNKIISQIQKDRQ